MESELLYILALKMCPKIGNVTTRKLIEHFGNASKVWNSSKSELKEIFGKNSSIYNNIGSNEFIDLAYKEIEASNKNNVQVIHFKQDKYPFLLKESYDFPVVIYFKGKELPSTDFKNISIVGTRNITNYGKKFIQDFIQEIANYPINIISGLAFGVDCTAQQTCLDYNIPTFGVLANGLYDIFPKTNKELANKIIENNGGFFSEYPFYANPDREKFLQRNRIIASFSQCTIIVESAFGGGAMTTAKYANQYNREVFAVPGNYNEKYSQGCNMLIKNNQAQILTSPKEVLEFLNLKNKRPKEKKIQQELFLDLNENQQKIVNLINKKGKIQIDELSENLELTVFSLMSSLLELELKGIVNPLSGKYFELKN